MRLVVVPLTIKQSLLYCQKTKALPLARKTPRIDDRMVQRVNKTWTEWQRSDVKWKKSLVGWTDRMLATISYEEWSLKSIPGRNDFLRRVKDSSKKLTDDSMTSGDNDTQKETNDTKAPAEKKSKQHEHGSDHISVDYIIKNKLPSDVVESIPVLYCESVFSQQDTVNKIKQLISRSKNHHKRYFWYSLIGAPLTLPFALLPVIPNIPGFYLLFRAWSHWKAMAGGKHLQYLLDDGHLQYTTSQELDVFYKEKLERAQLTQRDDVDARLIYQEDIERLVDIFSCKEIGPEILRALRQIEQKKKKMRSEEEKKQHQ